MKSCPASSPRTEESLSVLRWCFCPHLQCFTKRGLTTAWTHVALSLEREYQLDSRQWRSGRVRFLVDAVLSQGKPLQANCPPKRACGDAQDEWQLPHALRAASAPPRRSLCAHHQPPISVSLAGVPPQMRIVHSHSGRTGLRLNPASPQDKNEHSTVAVGATIGATLKDPDRQKSPLLRHAVVRPSAWRVPDHASPCSDPLHPHLGRLDP